MMSRKFLNYQNILFKVTILLISTVLLSLFLNSFNRADALDGNDFNPGRIIDDSIFYNEDSMSTSQIQAFLDAKMPNCDENGSQIYSGSTTRAQYGASKGYPAPYTCLNDYTQNIPSITNSGSDLCKGSISGGNRSAARIIHDVAEACGINPQVLIVMLQKEQSLITDTWPWPSQYDKAMGYACPDSGPNNSANCSSEYFGFYNQVYNAAKAFKRYEANPNSYNYKAGRNNTIYYHPGPCKTYNSNGQCTESYTITHCGSSNVFIQNQATASLYIYTPYQPNQAALNNLYGTGNSCSAYGNRNFWRMFNDWFGSTFNKNYTLIECEGLNYIHEKDRSRKRLLTAEANRAWGLDDQYFILDSYLCDLPTFDIEAVNLARSRKTDKLYLIDEGNYFEIYDQEISNAWLLGDIDATVAFFNSETITELLYKKGDLPYIATSTNPDRNDVYIVDNGERYTISGTPDLDKTNLKHLRGDLGFYTRTPVLSVDVIARVPSSGEIQYSFLTANGKYVFDYGRIRKILFSASSQWSDIPDGPTLSTNSPLLDKGHSWLGVSFNDGDNEYYTFNDAEDIVKVTSEEYIGNIFTGTSFGVSDNLISEFEGLYTVEDLNLVANTENIRLVECSDTDYLIERSVRRRRELTQEAKDNWGLNNYFYSQNDKACDYPEYDLPLERVVRSRNTGYVYYIDAERAYKAHSQTIADEYSIGDLETGRVPQFNPPSIKYLPIEQELPSGL